MARANKQLSYQHNKNRHYTVTVMFDTVVGIISDHYGFTRIGIQRAAEEAGISPQTIYNWLNGRTCRPQYVTLAKVIEAAGYEFTVQRAAPRTRKPHLRRVK